jgi:hypothetical protein
VRLEWVGAIAALVPAGAAWACPTCGTGDPTLTSAGTEAAAAGQVRAAADTSVGSDARGAGADAISRSDVRVAAAASFSATDRVTVSAELPVLWRAASLGDGSQLRIDGPGDAEARLRWTVWRDRPFAATQSLTLALGALLPTSPLFRDATGQPLDWRAQLGAGAVQPSLAVSHEYRRDTWALFSGLSALWPAGGWLGVQPGRSARANAAAQEELTQRLALRIALDARLDEAARVHGAFDPDSGGFIAYATPEVLFTPRPDVTLSASVRQPLAEALRGTQIHGTLYRCVVSLDF